MDKGDGFFKMLEDREKDLLMNENPKRTDIFTIGEEVKIRDSRFRIIKITPKKLTLRILPRDD